MYAHSIAPEEMIRGSVGFDAVDKCIALRIKYIGSAASGIIDIAATTGDMTLKHGVLSSEVADTTVSGNGIIDLSAEAATFKALINTINASANWEAWLEVALPDDATEASGTSKIINNVTGGDCTGANGYSVLIDTSAALYHSVGITNAGPASEVHSNDAQVYHEITQLRYTSTYATGTSSLLLYEVDDAAQVQTLVATLVAGATTVEKVWPTSGDQWPFVNSMSKRLVAKLVNSAAMTAATMIAFYGTHVYGPGVDKTKLRSNY